MNFIRFFFLFRINCGMTNGISLNYIIVFGWFPIEIKPSNEIWRVFSGLSNRHPSLNTTWCEKFIVHPTDSDGSQLNCSTPRQRISFSMFCSRFLGIFFYSFFSSFSWRNVCQRTRLIAVERRDRKNEKILLWVFQHIIDDEKQKIEEKSKEIPQLIFKLVRNSWLLLRA